MGEVVKGDQRGRTIGFPTANITLEEGAEPIHGIYTVRVRDGQEKFKGLGWCRDISAIARPLKQIDRSSKSTSSTSMKIFTGEPCWWNSSISSGPTRSSIRLKTWSGRWIRIASMPKPAFKSCRVIIRHRLSPRPRPRGRKDLGLLALGQVPLRGQAGGADAR